MKAVFKANKIPLLIVTATLVVFAALLPVLPSQMASHLMGNGVPTQFSSKYLVFLIIVIADIAGTTAINTWINQAVMPYLASSPLKFLLSLYFPLLFIVLTAMLILASYGLNGVAALIGFHVLYLAALAIVFFKK